MPLPSKLHRYLKSLDPEEAHRQALNMLKWYGRGVGPAGPQANDPLLQGKLFGQTVFPFGLAAGVSKNAEAIRGFQRLGLGFVEIGSIMPRRRRGNPRSQGRPRIIRLDSHSIINWMGLPSQGFDRIHRRIRAYRKRFGKGFFIIANLAMDPNTPYRRHLEIMAERLAPYVNAIVINVSCPNTAEVANRADGLVYDILAVKRVAVGAPVLVKFGPTEKPEDLDRLQTRAATAQADGFILLNTTPFPLRHRLTTHPAWLDDGWLRDGKGNPHGGYSGPGAFDNIVTTVARTRKNFPRTTIIATGPQSGGDVVRLFKAGANAVETNTWLTLGGPGVIAEAQRAILEAGGIASLQKDWLQTAT
jgi:dihydroorotate dehydrogenase